MAKSFEDLQVWKRSCRFAVNLIDLLRTNKDFYLKNQMLGAAISIPSNIAEGMTRKWPKERAHFLNIAQGSLSELDTQIEVCRRLQYVEDSISEDIIGRLSEIQRLLGGLIRSVRG